MLLKKILVYDKLISVIIMTKMNNRIAMLICENLFLHMVTKSMRNIIRQLPIFFTNFMSWLFSNNKHHTNLISINIP